MPAWGWIVLGIGLLGIELFAIDAQFYLVFIGAAAVIVGFSQLLGLALPEGMRWLVAAALAIVAVVAFRKRIYTRVKGTPGRVDQPLTIGDSVVVPVQLEPQQTCRVQYRGTTWTARNVSGAPLEAGKEAAIAHVDGLTLHIKPAH